MNERRRLKLLEILTREEIEVIHQNSLEILNDFGIKIYSRRALEILQSSGACIDYETKVAKIPDHLIEPTLKECPSSIRLCARNPTNDLKIDGSRAYLCTDGTGTQTLDLMNGERRVSTKEDIVRTAILADYLDGIDLYVPLVTPTDTPSNVRALHEFDASMNNMEKHFVTATTANANEARYELEMAATILGGREELLKTPMLSSITCPSSPLILGEQNTEVALLFGENNQNVVVQPMPLIGITSPITLAGALLLANIQFLALATILQLNKPGTQIMYSSDPLAIYPKTGAFAGAFPDATLVAAASIQIARNYKVSTFSSGWGATAKLPDAQASYEKSLSALTCYLAGADISNGAGLLDNWTALSYEQMIIDHEIFSIIRHLLNGIGVSEGTMALDLIKKVGYEGHYMAEKPTLNHALQCWMPYITQTEDYNLWRVRGGKTILQIANNKAKEIIANHKPNPLDRDIRKRLHEIIKDAEQNIPT